MSLVYVTTGVSIREARCWKDPCFESHDDKSWADILEQPDGSDLHRTARLRWVDLSHVLGADSTRYQEQARRVVSDHFRQEVWSPKRLNALPAELATLALLKDRIKPGDTIRLLHGETNRREAHVLAAMLESLNDRQLLSAGRDKVMIELKGPYRWDPTSRNTFDDGMALMWRENAEPGSFVLTAGYKAVLLWIMNKLSQRIRIGVEAVPSIRVFYRHEDSGELIALAVSPEGALNSCTKI